MIKAFSINISNVMSTSDKRQDRYKLYPNIALLCIIDVLLLRTRHDAAKCKIPQCH